MIIRNGEYSIYKGYELNLFESRYDVPIAEEEKVFGLCYHKDKELILDGFKDQIVEGMFCKPVLLKELDNAFSVQSYGLYRGIKVKVFDKPKFNKVWLTTKGKSSLLSLGFLDMGDYFGICKSISELDKLWEER